MSFLEQTNYDPLKNRVVKKSNSYIGTLLNYLSSSVGTGIWSLGVAFSSSGLFAGIFCVFLVRFLYAYCVKILIETSHKICRDLKVPSLTFPETVEKVFLVGSDELKKYSNTARTFMDIAMFFNFANGCVVFLFTASTYQEILSYFFGIDWSLRTFILLTAIPVAFISQVRELKYLVPISSAGNSLVFCAVVIIAYYLTQGPLTFEDKHYATSIIEWPPAVTTILFAVSNIAMEMAHESKMQKPRNYLGLFGILNITSFIISCFYTFVGFFSYLKYGSDIKGTVTLNLPMEPLSLIAKLSIGTSILVSFGFTSYICVEIIWSRFGKSLTKRKKSFYETLLRFAMVLVMAGLAILLPNLSVFISLLGIVFSGTLSIFIPPLVETIYLYPKGYGMFKWKLIINAIVIFLYIVVLITGVYKNVLTIIEIYK